MHLESRNALIRLEGALALAGNQRSVVKLMLGCWFKSRERQKDNAEWRTPAIRIAVGGRDKSGALLDRGPTSKTEKERERKETKFTN